MEGIKEKVQLNAGSFYLLRPLNNWEIIGWGDILIGEPKSVIAFAGRRVIQNTVKEELPEDFQTAEFVKDHGGIDLVIERKYLRSTISTLISILLKKKEVQNISEINDATDLSDTLQKTSKAV